MRKDSKLKVEINDKIEMEKFVLITIIGLIDSVIEEAVSIDDACSYIFIPFTVEQFKKNNFSKSIIKIVEEGCELEDIETLLPQDLNSELFKLKNKAICELVKLRKYSIRCNKWFGKSDYNKI